MTDDKAEIQTLSSEIVYQSRWMKVRHDQVRFADGSTGTYNTVERNNFVAVLALDAQGCLVLVEQYRYGPKTRTIEIPMGGLDPKFGPEPIDAARGELEEETGLVAGRMVHVGRVHINAAYMRQHFDVFFATGLGAGQQSLECGEIGLTVRHVPIAEVEAMIRDGILTNEHTLSAFCLARLKGLF